MLLRTVEDEFKSQENQLTCRRLFHGRGQVYDGLNFVNIDWYAPIILITLYQEIESGELKNIAESIFDLSDDIKSVQAQYRFQKLAPIELVCGQSILEHVVVEDELKYQVEFGKNQNVGLFLDMANARHWVNCNASGKKVLNLFAFTCAFSVAAIAGGAKHVVNVDNNNGVLNRGKNNHRLNELDKRASSYLKLDILKSFSRLKKYGPYDLLICDPPSYQVGSVDVKRDYAKVVRRIPQLLSKGGIAMLCLNSPDLTNDFLMGLVERECPECQLLDKISPPTVFKEANPDRGLKVFNFRYMP